MQASLVPGKRYGTVSYLKVTQLTWDSVAQTEHAHPPALREDTATVAEPELVGAVAGSMSRLRTCWVVQAPSGLVVTECGAIRALHG
jgi:hypothetical protein